MKKLVLPVLIAAAVLGSLVPNAAARSDRSPRAESREYIGTATTDWCYGALLGAGCVHFKARAAERFISVEIDDASGGDAYAVITQSGHGRGEYPHTEICGRTTEPLRIQGGVPVDVFVWAEVPDVYAKVARVSRTYCSGNKPGLVTSGTVTMTFSETKQGARGAELP